MSSKSTTKVQEMTESIDIQEFISFQASERYKAFILHGPVGNGKSTVAKKIAHVCGGEYIDLLGEFYKSDKLKERIDTFGPEKLKKFLLERKASKGLIIIDNIDFLLNTWTNREKMEFLNTIEKLSNVETKHTFVFVLQSDSFLEEKKITNTNKDSRIIDCRELSQIGG